ncbi:MAG: hypothetical protein ISS02_01000 [Candidatus Portnoybacteria bacterium]|nr:hypothetical protein [Candidatus Portnoybacteria bacterium]
MTRDTGMTKRSGNKKNNPSSKENPNKKTEIFHRFAGITKDKELFYVQIKEEKRVVKSILCLVSRQSRVIKKSSAKVECINSWPRI